MPVVLVLTDVSWNGSSGAPQGDGVLLSGKEKLSMVLFATCGGLDGWYKMEKTEKGAKVGDGLKM